MKKINKKRKNKGWGRPHGSTKKLNAIDKDEEADDENDDEEDQDQVV